MGRWGWALGVGVRAYQYGTAPATPPNTANQKSQTKNGRIFGKMRPVPFHLPKPRSAEAKRPVYICAASTASQRHASQPPSCGAVSLGVGGKCGRLWEKAVSPLAPAQTGYRLVGWGSTDGCATAFHRCRRRCACRSRHGDGESSTWCPLVPALASASDEAPQACLWRQGPSNGRWRLLGR